MKKIVSSLCVAMLLVLCIPQMSEAAENGTWTKVAYQKWNYQNEAEGTNLTATFSNESHVLKVEGVGAIPSYTSDALGNRPWHGLSVWYIELGSGVTSIGANAFSGFELLMKVDMHVNAFIEDTNAFGGARESCYFSFRGMNIQTRHIGDFPYTSLDSIVTFMQKYDGNYRYQLENYYMVGMAQNNTFPKLVNIAPATPSKETNANYPLINYKSELTSPMFGENAKLTIEGRRQGMLANEIIGMLIGDNTYVNAYNVSVFNGYTVYKTGVPYVYTMTIPNAYKFPGRTFSLIQITNGACQVLTDVDSSDETVSFMTDTPTGVYALVYKDQLSVLP